MDMGMELRDIEYFAVVAEHGSIGRAAEALNMSQPALSKSLRRLEQSIRAKVVQRTTKGVELTAVGSALLTQVRRLRMTMNDISRETADLSAGHAGNLRIGTPAAFALHLVPAACEALLKEAPRVSLKILVRERPPLIAGLLNGTLDLVVTTIQTTSVEDLVEVHLYDEEYVVYASAKHKLAKHKQLTLADLVNERWAMSDVNNPSWQQLSRVHATAGLPPPKSSLEVSHLPMRQQLVATSQLLAFGAADVARHASRHFPIVVLPVKNLGDKRNVGVVHRKEAYLPPVALRYIELLKKVTRDTVRHKQQIKMTG
jgi:DNA-binding transcriptional LysR family regulator